MEKVYLFVVLAGDSISLYSPTPYDVTSTVTYGHAIDITGWEVDPREIRVVNCYNAIKLLVDTNCWINFMS